MFKDIISSQEYVDLPLKTFEGDIVLVDNIQMVRMAARYLNQFNIFGFDTETKPIYKKGQTRRVALLQLATEEKAFLFKVLKIGLPDELISIFSNPVIIKAGVAIRDDIRGLQKMAPFKPEGFVELQDTASAKGIQNLSLKKLSAIVCGFRISKSQQLTNWESNELTDQQIVYAATDAWVSLKIYLNLTRQK